MVKWCPPKFSKSLLDDYFSVLPETTENLSKTKKLILVNKLLVRNEKIFLPCDGYIFAGHKNLERFGNEVKRCGNEGKWWHPTKPFAYCDYHCGIEHKQTIWIYWLHYRSLKFIKNLNL